MPNVKLRALIDEWTKDLGYISKVSVATKRIRDHRPDEPKSEDMELVINKAMPTFIFIKQSALVEKILSGLWVATFPDEQGPVPKKALKMSRLKEAYNLDNDSLQVLADVRNDLAHGLKHRTDWDSVDIVFEHVTFLIVKLKIWAEK